MLRPAIGFTPVFGEAATGRLKTYRWDGNPKRCPRKGEYYLSGAIVHAYRAPSNLQGEYFIAVPLKEGK